ncbi:MAG: hypothetical protein LUD79_03370 [Oscillospiraceae bacterium]|nr:hypothetical protein [Oscillospiraceae bacterium]
MAKNNQNENPKKKKKRFDYQMQRANSTHVTILCLVGAYFLYMAYRMLQNTRSGASEMSMPVTILLMVVMSLLAIMTFAYAGYVWYQIKKKSELTDEEAEELDAQMARADMENYGHLEGEYETDVSDVVEEFQAQAESEDAGEEEP